MNQRADACEQHFRKFLSPAFLQTRAIAGGDGKEELVIFAVGDCVVDLCAGRERQRFLIDLEAELARFRESGKIGAEAVAQIHHRVDAKVLG